MPDCPRCLRPNEERFYGPCHQCRTDLRGQARLQTAFRSVLNHLFPGTMSGDIKENE